MYRVTVKERYNYMYKLEMIYDINDVIRCTFTITYF